MKKLILVLALILGLTGCSVTKPTEEGKQDEKITDYSSLSILSPTGAPALALVDLLINEPEMKIDTVEGADVLQAAFVNPTSEYDVIIAPTNLGAKLASMQKTDYRLAAVLTWGNLTILGVDEADLSNPDKKIAAFGETAVVGLVFNAVKEELNLQAEIIWYASVSDAQAALLSGNVDAALIAEPAATATVMKAKKDLEKDFHVLADIQEAWEAKMGFKGYPQASVFVLASSYEEKQEEIDCLLKQMKTTIDFGNDSANEEALIEKIDQVIDSLGTPTATITAKAYSGMNLSYQEATSVKEECKVFLELFDIQDIDTIFLQ